MKYENIVLIALLLSVFTGIKADPTSAVADTIRTYTSEEVVISSTKETNSLKSLPGSVSLVTPAQISNMQFNDIKSLSALVPNMFIPDYGSRMSSAVYIRGIGARSSGQTIGMYVDNVPFLDKSTFDFDLTDIQRIEVLRGAQGSLYGRNAMGGIVNIYTLSPFDYQGIRANFKVGNYGQSKANLSLYQKASDKFAYTVGGYYNYNEGFFTNHYTGKKADNLLSGGAKAKLHYRPSKNFKADYTFMYDHAAQGAFPYAFYDKVTQKTDSVNFNDEGSYLRNTYTNSLHLEYTHSKFTLSSTTAYQLLKDDMHMDQDYMPQSIFTLHQQQKQNALTEEVTLKSNTSSNYQWSVGAFAFYDDMTTNSGVQFKEDGIATILQPVFDALTEGNPRAPKIVITDNIINIPGIYKTPKAGGALFHQSTYNNLFVEGLSLTAGLRLDYEKARLDYNTSSAMNLEIQMPGPMASMPFPPVDTALIGKESTGFLQLLPKAAIKYEFNKRNFVYGSVTKGYKAGGYNIQLFADLAQSALREKAMTMSGRPSEPSELSIEDVTMFNPEYTWSYEVGTKNELIKNRLSLDVAVFYMDVKDIQLTQFVESGQGRYIDNAGKAHSFGVEATLSARITNRLNFAANYGYTNATFRNYTTIKDKLDDDGNTVKEKVSYKGNYVPYAPQHTLSLNASYSIPLRCPVLDNIVLAAQYNAAGKIYWTEENDIAQNFYGLLNARVSLRKDNYRLDLWGANLANTGYQAFYFESMGNSFIQKGRPLQFGAEVALRF